MSPRFAYFILAALPCAAALGTPTAANAQVAPQTVAEFRAADVNNDGVLARTEWRGSRVAFNRLDRDADGVLTRREVLGVIPTVQNNRYGERFVDYDNDSDGVISADEWPGTRRSFLDRDLNRDGMITRREFRELSQLDNPRNDAVRTSNVTREVVVVDARERWTDTGLYVEPGDVINLQASGRIRMSGEANDFATPAGSVTGRHAPEAPVRDASAGGLLVRVGNATVRFVGASGSFVAANSGPVYLGVNDDYLEDNSGQFRVTLALRDR
jgi:Ca2+-binding EF-hand superfamily protein